MNDQIKEFAIKANPSSKEIYDVADAWPYNCAAWSGEDVANLVNLVVEECIDAVKNTPTHCAYTTYDLTIVNCTKNLSVNTIKEKLNYKPKGIFNHDNH